MNAADLSLLVFVSFDKRGLQGSAHVQVTVPPQVVM